MKIPNPVKETNNTQRETTWDTNTRRDTHGTRDSQSGHNHPAATALHLPGHPAPFFRWLRAVPRVGYSHYPK
ncbi:hypothetical protein E2C01_032663 [Portunus trituberculatus]|uniref:Uncharacterized protein n=1 Tax=Portunus trituberculatus TaxID=210409 RepID=A0A5B7EWJ1_PORTR|nr:hypothetical protein [Portunus trituberculatus]